MSSVSVVVPIFNAGKNLNKCISFILNQTFRDFELILVNDGSTDNSLNVCERYQQKDSRVKIINQKNSGSIVARRIGIESSQSKYVMFVDADDWIDSNMIQVMYDQIIINNLDIIVCNNYKVLGNFAFIKQTNDNIYFNEDKIYIEDEVKKELAVAYLHGHPFPATLWGKLYKKEFLIESGKYLEKIKFLGDDLFYNLEIFLKVNRVKIINLPLYYYRAGGMTSKFMPYMFSDILNGYQIQKEVIEEFYTDDKQNNYNGISLMLLNTFETCLYNLFHSDLNESEIKETIKQYTFKTEIIDCLENEGCIKHLDRSYLNAIRNNDAEHLYDIGQRIYKGSKLKNTAKRLLSKVC